MSFIKKATLLAAIPVLFLIKTQSYCYADEKITEVSNLKVSDIKKIPQLNLIGFLMEFMVQLVVLK
jgi:hypothetical protein